MVEKILKYYLKAILGTEKKGEKYFFNVDNSWKEEISDFGNLVLKNNKKKYEGNIVDAESIMQTIDKIYRADKKWYGNFVKIK